MARAVVPGAMNASVRLRDDGLLDVYVRFQTVRPPRTSSYRVARGVAPDDDGMARLAEDPAIWEDVVTVELPAADGTVAAFAGLEDLRFVPGTRVLTANRCVVAPACPRARAAEPCAVVAEVSEDGRTITERAVARTGAKNLHGVEGEPGVLVDVLRREVLRGGEATPIAEPDAALRGYRMSTAAVRAAGDPPGTWRCLVHTPHAAGYRHREARLVLLDRAAGRWALRAGDALPEPPAVLDPDGDRFRYLTTWLPDAGVLAGGAGDAAAVVEVGGGGAGVPPRRAVLAARDAVHRDGTVVVGPGERAEALARELFAKDPGFRGTLVPAAAVPEGTRAADAVLWGDGDPHSPVLARIVEALAWAGTAVFVGARARPTWAGAPPARLAAGLYLLRR